MKKTMPMLFTCTSRFAQLKLNTERQPSVRTLATLLTWWFGAFTIRRLACQLGGFKYNRFPQFPQIHLRILGFVRKFPIHPIILGIFISSPCFSHVLSTGPWGETFLVFTTTVIGWRILGMLSTSPLFRVYMEVSYGDRHEWPRLSNWNNQLVTTGDPFQETSIPLDSIDLTFSMFQARTESYRIPGQLPRHEQVAMAETSGLSLQTLKDDGSGVSRYGQLDTVPRQKKRWITNGFVWKCWVNIPNEIAI